MTSKQFQDMAFEIEALKAECQQLAMDKANAYNERNCVVAALAHLFPSGIQRTDIPDWDKEWHNCVFIDTPAGQMSWHYHDAEAMAFMDLPQYWGRWDGHTTAEKYERLAKLKDVDILTAVKTLPITTKVYVEETPQWMLGMAHNIAVEHLVKSGNRDALERDIVGAMKEAAREVALFFAANPEKLTEVPRA